MLTERIKLIIAAIALLTAAALSGFATWSLTYKHYQVKIAQNKATYTEKIETLEAKIKEVEKTAFEQTNRAISQMNEAQDKLKALDEQATQDLSNAKTENDRLRDSITTGNGSVYLNTKGATSCSISDQSGNTSTGSMGDATSFKLPNNIGQDILSIREGILTDQSKIIYLQSYVNDIVKQCKTP